MTAALEAEFSVVVGTASASPFRVDSTLRLEKGVLVLFGPSGAGKSLTLQALAGLVRPKTGRIFLNQEPLFDAAKGLDVAAHRRGIGYVPQHNALFPFCSVEENVAFGLRKSERRKKDGPVPALLEELGLWHLRNARPMSLSGGERQRVAFARALAVRPRLLLLDEPFASIDTQGRVELRELLKSLLQRHQIPAVFVTHDPDEAVALGDVLVHFERGRTTTSGDPSEILCHGRSVLVTGQATGPAHPSKEGEARLLLRSATLSGPPELLQHQGAGPVALLLQVPPARSGSLR